MFYSIFLYYTRTCAERIKNKGEKMKKHIEELVKYIK